jgi:hypothetical protein
MLPPNPHRAPHVFDWVKGRYWEHHLRRIRLRAERAARVARPGNRPRPT